MKSEKAIKALNTIMNGLMELPESDLMYLKGCVDTRVELKNAKEG